MFICSICVQIQQWEQNLEKLNLDLFRLRCYLSSLQGSELPNPKSLLAVASRPSKSMLGRLGVFSVSSFHALVGSCACNASTCRTGENRSVRILICGSLGSCRCAVGRRSRCGAAAGHCQEEVAGKEACRPL